MSDCVAAISETTIQQGSQSFAAAVKLFDRRTRDDAVMLYAWCRHCDDVIDGQLLGHDQKVRPDQDQHEQLERLRLLKEKTDLALSGAATDDVSFEALRRVIRRNSIDPLFPQQLLDGFEMDVRGRTYATFRDTEDYCYHVAGVVGVMMAQVMGAREDSVLDRASDLGIAFQLTNICRDVVEDARAGRCYLPADLLQQCGASKAEPDSAANRRRLYLAACQLLGVAERYYASAYCGLPHLPFRSAWAIASARRIYRAIGRKLVRSGPEAWDERISTGGTTKVALAALALGDVLLTRVYRPRGSRVGLFNRPISGGI